MSDEAHDKQHAATGKHLADLRKQGNVLRSRDLSGALVFMTSITLLIFMSAQIKTQMAKNFFLAFSNFSAVVGNHDYLINIIKNIVLSSFYLLLPLFIIAFITALFSPFIFGGWNFTLDVLQFKLSKLNPTSNLARLFKPKTALLEILKSMIKSSFFLAILIFYVISAKNNIFYLSNEALSSAINTSYFTVKNFIIILSGSLVFIILMDVVYNYFRYQTQAKMSTEQIKEEHKSTEGNPEVKRKIRMKQIAIIMQRLKQTIPKANVIITNPTHYAVALRYDGEKDHAPKVVAKGKAVIAQHIKKIAISHAVPIYEAPELARAIYYTTKVNGFIHPALYKAVALVLSYVFQLKHYQMGKGRLPEYISNLEIPSEFIYKE